MTKNIYSFQGYNGNGFECTADFESDRKEICFQFPMIENGEILNQDEEVVEITKGLYQDKGMAAGEILFYVCDSGYEIIGASDLKCEEDGLFSETPPICRDRNECQDNPCDPTAICRNYQGQCLNLYDFFRGFANLIMRYHSLYIFCRQNFHSTLFKMLIFSVE